MKIITGKTGEAHIASEDDRSRIASTWGPSDVVLNRGQKLKCERTVLPNTVRIYDGDLILQGTHARIPYGHYDDLTIDNGAIGFNRIDLIVVRYECDENGFEVVTLSVIKGEPTSGTPIAPEATPGDILAGDDLHELALHEVLINGIDIVSITPLFEVQEDIIDMVTIDPEVIALYEPYID
jgi:hypothetical protein